MSSTEPEVGDVFDHRYEIQRVISDGERKRTFLARDTKLDGLVALGVVKPEAFASDPGATQREARILRRIGSHDNIVSVYDFDVTDDTGAHYVVFEYLAGGKLAEFLRNEDGPLSLQKILQLAEQVTQGISHLHQNGIIHRDVQPANILFDDRGNAHLGDFDSAIAIGESLDALPITNNPYLSPEERRGEMPGIRSDLYSLGAILQLAVTGHEIPADTVSPRKLRPDLPSSFSDLIESLLTENPDGRPADTGAVLQWLEDIRKSSDLDVLLSTEESDTVEFKSSLIHPYELDPGFQTAVDMGTMPLQKAQRAMQERLEWEVTKTVAAFLNTHGGILLVGVSPSRNVLGIEPDFKYLGRQQDGDGWQLFLKELIVKRLGEAVWSGIRPSLITHGEKTVAIISCPRRSTETWHHGGVVDKAGNVDHDDHFYVRMSSATQEIKGPELIRWIREHW